MMIDNTTTTNDDDDECALVDDVKSHEEKVKNKKSINPITAVKTVILTVISGIPKIWSM